MYEDCITITVTVIKYIKLVYLRVYKLYAPVAILVSTSGSQKSNKRLEANNTKHYSIHPYLIQPFGL